MKLDRYTEKAQEAILAAQRLAQDADSPVLDAEHLLAALLAGSRRACPPRCSASWAPIRAHLSVELAAILSRRAKIEGGSLSLDPRARQLLERAEDEAKRLQDEYVSTEHLLLAATPVRR